MAIEAWSAERESMKRKDKPPTDYIRSRVADSLEKPLNKHFRQGSSYKRHDRPFPDKQKKIRQAIALVESSGYPTEYIYGAGEGGRLDYLRKNLESRVKNRTNLSRIIPEKILPFQTYLFLTNPKDAVSPQAKSQIERLRKVLFLDSPTSFDENNIAFDGLFYHQGEALKYLAQLINHDQENISKSYVDKAAVYFFNRKTHRYQNAKNIQQCETSAVTFDFIKQMAKLGTTNIPIAKVFYPDGKGQKLTFTIFYSVTNDSIGIILPDKNLKENQINDERVNSAIKNWLDAYSYGEFNSD